MTDSGRRLLPPCPVPDLDDFAERAAELLGAPVGLVSLVDARGQTLPGAFGLPEPWNSERWTPLSHSFCQYVVAAGQPLVIGNSDDAPLVAGNGAVLDLGVIAYLGVPLTLAGMTGAAGTAGAAAAVGGLCAIDHKPREWSQIQVVQLIHLASDCSRSLQVALERHRSG